MRPGQFLIIGERLINLDYIMTVEGCLPGQRGVVTLHVDQRAGAAFAGSDHVQYTRATTTDRADIIGLVGDHATAFRTQWNALSAPLTGSAGGTG